LNILVINGSPKGGKSNTLKLTNAFISGIHNAGMHSIETIDVSKKNIEPCQGCFCCWEKTPGICVIKDDMNAVFETYNNADLIIWSFPLYYFGIPSKTKAFIDRLLPNNMPEIVMHEDGSADHVARYDLSHQRHVLISTCGFFTIEHNYEALVTQFEILFGNHLTTLLCPEGELFRIPQLAERTGEYLSMVTKAGEEYITQGFIAPDTENTLKTPLYPAEQFMEMANASWNYENIPSAEPKKPETDTKAERLLRQMAAIYKPHGQDKEIIFEFYFTDIQKTYQLVLGKTACGFKKGDFLPFTLRIETSFEIWRAISEGSLNGTDALFQHKYSVTGDFSTIEYLENCFSVKSNSDERKPAAQKRDMRLFMLPWIAYWVAIPLSPDFGAYIALIITASMPIFYALRRATVYDTISVFCVTVLSILSILQIDLALVVTLSYAVFGLMWLVSLCTRIPLCAWYSSNSWGGDAAFDNPLFLLTNKIICTLWGIMYLVSCVCVWFIMRSPYAHVVGLITQVGPAVMGIFTAVFSRKFPAYYARKK
jgi:multimeric flavodoxin WrbA/putative sterol carrier protein